MKEKDFLKMVGSIKEAGKIKKGIVKPKRIFQFKTPDVRKIRTKLKISQTEFALMIGVSPRTIQNWEQGRREPEGPAKALLVVAKNNPEAILHALHS